MIGIFDSGVGGLSVYREIRKILPEERYIYYSDSAHCPYGEKSREYILDRARWITGHLLEEGADIIVVACNTATAAAIKELREEFPVRFIGMEPAIKPAVKATGSGVVGVLATAGTLRGSKYMDTRSQWAEGVRVVEHVGQGFVELVEKGVTEGEIAEDVVERSLRPLLEEGADTIVLGCTHYPFLEGAIRNVARRAFPGRDTKIIDPAPAVARHLLEVMQENGLVRNDGFSIKLDTSGDVTALEDSYRNLL